MAAKATAAGPAPAASPLGSVLDQINRFAESIRQQFRAEVHWKTAAAPATILADDSSTYAALRWRLLEISGGRPENLRAEVRVGQDLEKWKARRNRTAEQQRAVTVAVRGNVYAFAWAEEPGPESGPSPLERIAAAVERATGSIDISRLERPILSLLGRGVAVERITKNLASMARRYRAELVEEAAVMLEVMEEQKS